MNQNTLNVRFGYTPEYHEGTYLLDRLACVCDTSPHCPHKYIPFFDCKHMRKIIENDAGMLYIGHADHAKKLIKWEYDWPNIVEVVEEKMAARTAEVHAQEIVWSADFYAETPRAVQEKCAEYERLHKGPLNALKREIVGELEDERFEELMKHQFEERRAHYQKMMDLKPDLVEVGAEILRMTEEDEVFLRERQANARDKHVENALISGFWDDKISAQGTVKHIEYVLKQHEFQIALDAHIVTFTAERVANVQSAWKTHEVYLNYMREKQDCLLNEQTRRENERKLAVASPSGHLAPLWCMRVPKHGDAYNLEEIQFFRWIAGYNVNGYHNITPKQGRCMLSDKYHGINNFVLYQGILARELTMDDIVLINENAKDSTPVGALLVLEDNTSGSLNVGIVTSTDADALGKVSVLKRLIGMTHKQMLTTELHTSTVRAVNGMCMEGFQIQTIHPSSDRFMHLLYRIKPCKLMEWMELGKKYNESSLGKRAASETPGDAQPAGAACSIRTPPPAPQGDGGHGA